MEVAHFFSAFLVTGANEHVEDRIPKVTVLLIHKDLKIRLVITDDSSLSIVLL